MPPRVGNGGPEATASNELRQELGDHDDVEREAHSSRRIADERGQCSGELAAVLDAVADGLVVYDQEGRITAINAAARAILGYSADVIPPQSIAQRVDALEIRTAYGERLPLTDLPVARALRGETVQRVELSFRNAAGLSHVLTVSSAPVRDGSGAVRGAVATLRDITDQKQATLERERLLSQVEHERERIADLAAEAQQRAGDINAVIESIADAIFVCDKSGAIVKVNRAGRELITDDAPRDIVLAIANLKPRFRSGRAISTKGLAITKALRGQIVRGQEELATHPRSGKRLDLLISAAPLRDELGVITGAVEVAADIGMVRELSGVARRRGAELQAVLDNMFDAVLVADQTGNITIANEAAVRLLGFETMEELHRPLGDLPGLLKLRSLNGDALGVEELALARALAGYSVEQVDLIGTNVRSERDEFIRMSAATIRDESGDVAGAVAVLRDVTELTELDRLQDEFISVAAHELKTPVAIMKGYAQALVRNDPRLPRGSRQMLDAINRGADRIDRVVKDLLDISRLRIGRFDLAGERIDLCELATQIVNRMSVAAQHHELRLMRADQVVVTGDRERLEQVLMHLLDNAMKYSPKGGDIEVEVVADTCEVVISVRDHGIGIPRDKQARVFQRFYRAHAGTPHDYAGMGVGLYIAREIILQHNGRMWLESDEAAGSTVYISLPLGTC